MMARVWNCFSASYLPRDVSEGCYFDSPAGRFMAVRGKYKRHWNAKQAMPNGYKSFAVDTKDEAKRLCEQWAAEAEGQQ